MEKKVITVSKLNQYVKNIIEGDINLNNILVQGEITNLTKHYTGHYYFSLKDEESKVSCMMFSYNVKNLKFDLKNGDLVLIYGYMSVYEKTGTYQLYARNIEPFGLGQELLKIEALKKKLKEEGVFDLPKKEIPKYPRTIGLITSSVGAAVHDFIHTIQSRWNVEILVFPCLVQGKDAPESIVKALELTSNYDIDTLIIGRGGGNNEDLSAYNDERVVRAVLSCPIPIISAIGHQIDSSIVDLVSDYSAITPTEAGVIATPNKNQIIQDLISNREYMNSIIERKIDKLRQLLLEISSSKGLISPMDRLLLEKKQNEQLIERITYNMKQFINRYQNELASLNGKLISLNPYGVLSKGYSLIYNKNKNVITSINDIEKNDIIIVNMKDGKLIARVEDKGEK